MIHYGIAVWLPSISDWIDSVVPPLTNEEINRRSILQRKLKEQDKVQKNIK